MLDRLPLATTKSIISTKIVLRNGYGCDRVTQKMKKNYKKCFYIDIEKENSTKSTYVKTML